MSGFTPVPKPQKRSDEDKTVARLVKAWGRQKRWRDRAIVKAKGKPRPKVKERNEKRIARRHKLYSAHLKSAYWLDIRYERWMFDDGYCVCEWCVNSRNLKATVALEKPEGVTLDEAFRQIPVWFTAKGSKESRRIRGFSTHHVRYRELGHEQLKDLRTMYPHHHAATEAKYSTRRRFLKRAQP